MGGSDWIVVAKNRFFKWLALQHLHDKTFPSSQLPSVDVYSSQLVKNALLC